MEEKEVFEYRKTLLGTLRKLSIGETIVIKNKDFKAAFVRTAASNLKKKEKREYRVSDAGRIDDVIVTRIQ